MYLAAAPDKEITNRRFSPAAQGKGFRYGRNGLGTTFFTLPIIFLVELCLTLTKNFYVYKLVTEMEITPLFLCIDIPEAVMKQRRKKVFVIFFNLYY